MEVCFEDDTVGDAVVGVVALISLIVVFNGADFEFGVIIATFGVVDLSDLIGVELLPGV